MRSKIGTALVVWAISTGMTLAQGKAESPLLPNLPSSVSAVPQACENACCFWDDCCPVNPSCDRFWFRSDYLLWWVKKGPLATPLVTYGSDRDFPFQGALGQPGTAVAYGGSGLNFGTFSGYRLSSGLALTADGGLAVQGSWMQLEKRSVRFNAASDAGGNPVIARPILNAVNGQENSELDSSAATGIAGGIGVASSSRLQGWDLNLAASGPGNAGWLVQGLVGFRALDLTEAIVIQESFRDITGFAGGAGLTFLGAPVMTAAPLTGSDSFHTYNHFYGPQLGSQLQWRSGLLSLSVLGKLALGVNQELVVINGSSSAVVNPGTARSFAVGDVLALGSNIGRYFRNEFAVVPEGGLDLGVQLTSLVQAHIGYTFLYWSNVVRPGDALDRTVNRFTVPTDQNFGMGTGPGRPAFTWHGTDFWAQGINFGLAICF